MLESAEIHVLYISVVGIVLFISTRITISKSTITPGIIVLTWKLKERQVVIFISTHIQTK